MSRLLSWLGIDAQLRRLRIAWGEGALAAGDRARLLQLAWIEEREHLKRVIGLLVVVIGLSTVAVALLSVAVVVQFWDTPHRSTAAWCVAGFWLIVWVLAILALLGQTRRSRGAFDPAFEILARDWDVLRNRWGETHDGSTAPGSPRAAQATFTKEQLLERIETQRLRIQTLEAPDPRPAPQPLPLSAEALRLARTHPLATGAAAAVTLVVVGPKRLLRWGIVAAPVLWRLRR